MRPSSQTSRRAASTLAFAALSLAACPDTSGVFDDFVERSEPFRKGPSAGECGGAVDLSGTYLQGVEVAIDRTKPLRFRVDVDIDLTTNTIDFAMQALAAPPNNGDIPAGTPVGEIYTATSPITPADGKFVLAFPSIVVPTAANPILPAPVTATLTFSGCTSTATFSCGTIAGSITDPVTLALDGSSWALTPLADGVDPMSITLVASCPE
ncbi:MAG: hypothetical protein JNJ59_19585 [Deltaproteobacteria bacterium]|nr:hypothetical protein [Deltaproteobacteria bacterium]